MTTKTVSRKAAPSAASKSHAIKLLTADHAEVHGLFKNYSVLCESGADGDQCQLLAEQICLLLMVHTSVEEEIFYPEAREAEVGRRVAQQSRGRTCLGQGLDSQIRSMEPDDDLYDAKVKMLGEFVSHHVQEEQDKIFPKCVKAAMDLKAIGARMATRKA